MAVAYTLTVADELPSDWPVASTNLFVLVGLDCAAIANVTLHLNDVVLLVSHRPREASTQQRRLLRDSREAARVTAAQRFCTGVGGQAGGGLRDVLAG